MRLRQKVTAEFVGSAFLVAAVIGSGIAASRLSPEDVGLQLLENSVVTGAVLVALILALHPVSASFNPVITVLERVLGTIPTRVAAALVAAQVAGAVVGAVVANLMFDEPAISISQHVRTGPGLWLGEAVATLGLVVIVFGTLRGADRSRVAFAVGGYILGAYWFTSSTSFANPAVTVARTLSDTFAGIAPASVPAFVLAQILGGAAGLGVVTLLHPRRSDTATLPSVKARS
ncbi:aquaporin [Terrabacter sp. Ter38]|uniref:aquaporin n=1 Tax=Terrabacter sp. Ter38 TaxID=2926030 RepID=UPI002118B862|nr:aquaporin [Terrabacter sp. Ter38]